MPRATVKSGCDFCNSRKICAACFDEMSAWSSHASPNSAARRATVFFAAPVMRQVARCELPSTRHATMRERSSIESLFIYGNVEGFG